MVLLCFLNLIQGETNNLKYYPSFYNSNKNLHFSILYAVLKNTCKKISQFSDGVSLNCFFPGWLGMAGHLEFDCILINFVCVCSTITDNMYHLYDFFPSEVFFFLKNFTV